MTFSPQGVAAQLLEKDMSNRRHARACVWGIFFPLLGFVAGEEYKNSLTHVGT